MLDLLWVFLIGGAICAAGQVLLDLTALTPARVLVLFVVLGAVLTAAGVYEPLVKLASCGATVPITGFGYALARGVEKAVAEKGFLGALTGGLTATSAGVTAAVFLGWLCALVKRPGDKS